MEEKKDKILSKCNVIPVKSIVNYLKDGIITMYDEHIEEFEVKFNNPKEINAFIIQKMDFSNNRRYFTFA